MIDAIISGNLIRDTELKISAGGTKYTQFLLTVSIGEAQPIIVSGVAFSDLAERVALLRKGDALAVIGSLKPTEWADKKTGEIKHGLNITAGNALSPYDLKKRRPVPDTNPVQGQIPFYDEIGF